MASASGIGSSVPARARAGMAQYSFVRTSATLLTWIAAVPALATGLVLLLMGPALQAAIAEPPGDLRADLIFGVLKGAATALGLAVLTLALVTAGPSASARGERW